MGDQYYKKKERKVEVSDDFVAVVVNDNGSKLELDQENLETVINSLGREVVVLWGKHGGWRPCL